MRARGGGEYRIFIARPAAGIPAPAGGFPVIYALDGNTSFAILAQIVRARSSGPFAGIEPAIVVGIGYPTDAAYDMDRRIFDDTPPAKVLRLAPRPDGTPWPAVGGADLFLDFIAAELMPAILCDCRGDRNRQALFGHSLGGLFVLHVLFTRPSLFRHYVAASPSIWWNDCFIHEEERAFTADLRSQAADADLLIAVGGEEQTLTAAERARPDWEARALWKSQNRMLDNARALSQRLAAFETSGLRTSYVEFAGEDHGSVVPAALSRAVTFILSAGRSP